jgi:hypothetical protein
MHLFFNTLLLLLLLLLLHRTLYLHNLKQKLVSRLQELKLFLCQRLASIFLLSLLSVMSLMLTSIRLLHHPKSQHSSRSQVKSCRALVHFAADVFQAAVDCAFRLGSVLLQ